MFSAMCAWVLFANLQANLSPFRCIPHYVTQRDVNAIIAHWNKAARVWLRQTIFHYLIIHPYKCPGGYREYVTRYGHLNSCPEGIVQGVGQNRSSSRGHLQVCPWGVEV